MKKTLMHYVSYIVSFIPLICFFSFIILAPKIFLWCAQVSFAPADAQAKTFKLGVETLSASFLHEMMPRGNVQAQSALITNHTGKDQQGNRTLDVLLNKGLAIQLMVVPHFPEDRSGEVVLDTDATTQTTVLHAYGHGAMMRLDQYLANVEVIFFDMQDIGMRTFRQSTVLIEAMKLAARCDKKLVVLDRPNLLGASIEGAFNTSSLPVPLRYGMTIGELAHYFNEHVLKNIVALHIIPMQHYHRQVDQAGISTMLKHELSPNITTVRSCHGYSMLRVFQEVAPFDVGIGTDKAFQCIMLPDKKYLDKHAWYSLRALLRDFGVESKLYHYYHSAQRQEYTGLELLVSDIERFSSFNTTLAMLEFFAQRGVPLVFSPYFDRIMGTAKVRQVITGSLDRKELEREVNMHLKTFLQQAAGSFLYAPLPRVITV